MSTPHKSETPLAGGAVAEKQNTQAGIFNDDQPQHKRLANLKARAALAGHVVHELADGGYMAISTKWAGMARYCPDAAALGAFLAQLGAR